MVPAWLRELIAKNKAALHDGSTACVDRALQDGALHTVCHEAKCPNRGECFAAGETTIMILGGNCTRGCKFCAVGRACPRPVDADEPRRAAQAVKEMGIKYVVLTSPTRDDLSDGGARHFYDVIAEIKNQNRGVLAEPLVPDFAGNIESLQTVLSAGPAVLAHNIETVPALYGEARAGADYKRSLNLLKESKKIMPEILTKSGIMLGLGETEAQLRAVIEDLAANKVDILTLGQYLAPSPVHNAVRRYAEPEEYARLKDFAMSAGFKAVAAGPLVRSSYKAGELYRAAKKCKI
ncbi:MAG: lipoyl synthase [Elusimicrobium sp.]|jgi:lipoic acid synthetase|nr:lipoyl synthase [Elusimicrobium sp.]